LSGGYMQLLEVTARAVHLIIEWGDSGLSVADGLCNLLKACPLYLLSFSFIKMPTMHPS